MDRTDGDLEPWFLSGISSISMLRGDRSQEYELLRHLESDLDGALCRGCPCCTTSVVFCSLVFSGSCCVALISGRVSFLTSHVLRVALGVNIDPPRAMPRVRRPRQAEPVEVSTVKNQAGDHQSTICVSLHK
jgi:hypothetical protein